MKAYADYCFFWGFPSGYSVAVGEFSGDEVEGKSINQAADTASIRRVSQTDIYRAVQMF